MKKVGSYLIWASFVYLIGQLIWLLTLIFDNPFFGSEFYETLVLVFIYTLFGFFILISGIKLYKTEK
tara:strand:- start:372 stop:572 length:201 start_codon:yes stop_codon:yes gene_type:complete